MKAKIIPLVIVAVAVAAFWFRDRWLPQPPGLTDYLGYVEAETRLIGPLQAGRLVERPAAKGAAVKAGGLLFRLDDTAKKIDVTAAEAALKAAESTRDDLLSGKRQAEIAPVLAQRDQAAAAGLVVQQGLAQAAAAQGVRAVGGDFLKRLGQVRDKKPFATAQQPALAFEDGPHGRGMAEDGLQQAAGVSLERRQRQTVACQGQGRFQQDVQR